MTRTSQQSYLQRLGFKDPDKTNQRHGLACEYLREKMLPAVEEEAGVRAKAAAFKMLGDRGQAVRVGQHRELCGWLYHALRYDSNRVPRASSPFDGWESPWDDAGAIFDQWHELIKSKWNWASILRQSDVFGGGELAKMIPGKSGGAKGFLDVAFFPSQQEVPMQPRAFCDPATGLPYVFDKVVDLPRLSISPFFDFVHRRTVVYFGEVKITPEPAEVILQQLLYYRDSIGAYCPMIWLLADFDVSDLVRMAADQLPELRCFRIGPAFEEWCANRAMPVVDEL